jgi:hypothetical protein
MIVKRFSAGLCNRFLSKFHTAKTRRCRSGGSAFFFLVKDRRRKKKKGRGLTLPEWTFETAAVED